MDDSRSAAGRPAPDFTATTLLGDPFDLRDLRGKRVWLTFHRYIACPLTRTRLRALSDRFAELARYNVTVVAVVQSPPDKIKKYLRRRPPAYYVLADPEQAIYRRYGVGRGWVGFISPSTIVKTVGAVLRGFFPGIPDGDPLRMPADFLIDENGVIRDAFFAADFSETIPEARVQRFIHTGSFSTA